jgi:hypothetical protein
LKRFLELPAGEPDESTFFGYSAGYSRKRYPGGLHEWLAGKTTRTDRYYISNAEMEAEKVYRYLRGHWSIENRLHWSLDAVFREDAAPASRDHAPENLNILI